jgi:hypothetical protein
LAGPPPDDETIGIHAGGGPVRATNVSAEGWELNDDANDSRAVRCA